MNKSKTLLLSAAFAAITTVTQGVTFNTITTPFTGVSIPGGLSVGHRFDVDGGGVLVNSLAFVSSSNGPLNAGTSAQVGIFSYSGPQYSGSFSASPIASVTINSLSSVSDFYAWQNLETPLYLAPGRYGILVTSLTLGGSDMIGNNQLGNGLPAFTSGQNVIATPDLGDAVGGGLATPSIDFRRFKIANFDFTPVPEPETYAMIAGLGLVGFGLWRKRQ